MKLTSKETTNGKKNEKETVKEGKRQKQQRRSNYDCYNGSCAEFFKKGSSEGCEQDKNQK